MWDRVMAVNSFVVWPLAFIFLIYAAGRTLVYFQWKLLIVAAILFGIVTVVGVILGIIND